MIICQKPGANDLHMLQLKARDAGWQWNQLDHMQI